ncbi:EF hand domain-containing protein [Albidovulum inexpectatum]|uniref:EF hand domain-containing protein n=1 Tax=Albidovulum inexpectatum TaxID=196587 RepID=A0A2S5JK88_9RHOB|nr:EF-hand domain-containing protein [Albidovulum inexpectatum]PPB81675.1 EF hand domain-containing protein [Albidovulum inexpectatum]
MKTINTLALVLGTAILAVAANAQTVVSDTDGNGTYSIEELRAAYPDLTDEVFATVDANGDGQVDADELAAAQEAGVLPN